MADGGLDGDLSTLGDNDTFSRTFDVVVNPINDTPMLAAINSLSLDEDAPEQSIDLAGIQPTPSHLLLLCEHGLAALEAFRINNSS